MNGIDRHRNCSNTSPELKPPPTIKLLETPSITVFFQNRQPRTVIPTPRLFEVGEYPNLMKAGHRYSTDYDSRIQ